jgi:hypothetical protein
MIAMKSFDRLDSSLLGADNLRINSRGMVGNHSNVFSRIATSGTPGARRLID